MVNMCLISQYWVFLCIAQFLAQVRELVVEVEYTFGIYKQVLAA